MKSLLKFLNGVWKYFTNGSVTERKWVVHASMQVKTLRGNFSIVSGKRLSTFSLSKPCESVIVKKEQDLYLFKELFSFKTHIRA